MYRRPIITLHGANGDSITFDGVGSWITLRPGTTGIGAVPVELSHVDLPTGGSVLTHKRAARRTMTFPLDVHTGDYGELEKLRRRLEDCVFSGTTRIEIFSEVFGSRWIMADYKSGLEGDFSWAKKITSQPLLLEFEAADPYFYGTEIEQVFEVSPVRKPFITGRNEGAIRYNFAGDMTSVSNTSWGGFQTGELEDDTSNSLSGRSVKVMPKLNEWVGFPPIGLSAESIPVSRLHVFSASVKGSQEVTHVRIQFNVYDRSGRVVESPSKTFQVSTEWGAVQMSVPGDGYRANLFVTPLRSIGGRLERAPDGAAVWVDDFLFEQGSTAGQPFNIRSEHEGRSYSSVKADFASAAPIAAERLAGRAGSVPFFPIKLSSSTVAGLQIFNVDSDGVSKGVVTVTGPGSDVEIRKGDEVLRIKGEIRSQITIDSRDHVYDVWDENGALWDRMIGEPSILHLDPGENRLRVTMVDATPESSVKLSYAPAFRAGH